MNTAKTLYLIDASAYFYRAFFALPPLSTARGLPTNAIYGFTTMLQKLLKEHSPDYMVAVMDSAEPTFRHEDYEDYKANRDEMPDNLSVQLPYIADIIKAFNIAMVAKPGYEADDIIGTLALQAAADGARSVIVSGDKDMCQLLGPGITLLDTMKNTTTDALTVREKYGVGPGGMNDFFGLVGDASDNVPGVPGIGPKTATALLKEFGSMEGIYENIDRITKKKVKESLSQHREQAFLSRKLVTIDTGVELDCSWCDFKVTAPDEPALRGLYEQFEFYRLLQNLGPDAGPSRAERRYRLVTACADIEQLVAELRRQKAFAVDLETTSPDPMRAEIVGVSLAWQDNEAWYVPVGHRGFENQPDRHVVLSLLQPVLEDAGISKTGHNSKYEYILFKRNGITMRGIGCDTMIASYVLNPSKYRHSLDDVARDYLGVTKTSYSDLVGTGKKAVTIDLVPVERVKEYACEDADITGILARTLLPKIQEESARELFFNIEMPLLEVLAEMEMQGVKIDTGHLADLAEEFNGALEIIQERVFSCAGEQFNINSPKQLGQILFEKLGLPVRKKTKTGYATDITTLTELAKDHPLPGEVLAYRSLAKLKSTYIDSLPALVHPQTGRIHTSYNQTVTATGRLSSSDPNLQNIPIRTDEGKRIREAFVGEAGCKVLSADYSQIELRILAHLSGDRTLIDAFAAGEDIHSRTAAEIWGGSGGAVTDSRRRDAKVINFGIIYGMSAYGLSRELDIEPRVAQEYIDGYFKNYRGVRRYLDGILEGARKNGYVTTLMNRKRYLPEINDKNQTRRNFAERTAINAPIQGTAADLIKKAMITMAHEIKCRGLRGRMIMQVHDELVFEVPEEEIQEMKETVKSVMENVLDLEVPLKVDVRWGDNWREAH